MPYTAAENQTDLLLGYETCTASEDDSSPIIMVWDLRNARAPEKVRIKSFQCQRVS